MKAGGDEKKLTSKDAHTVRSPFGSSLTLVRTRAPVSACGPKASCGSATILRLCSECPVFLQPLLHLPTAWAFNPSPKSGRTREKFAKTVDEFFIPSTRDAEFSPSLSLFFLLPFNAYKSETFCTSWLMFGEPSGLYL